MSLHELMEALRIFASASCYELTKEVVYVHRDAFNVGIPPRFFSAEQIDKLKSLGFYVSDEFEGFYSGRL